MSADKSSPPSGEPTATKQRHHPSDLERVRQWAIEGGIDQPIRDEDAAAVLDHFACPDELYRPMPDDMDSPEFWAEIQRRESLNLPPLNARTVSAYLRRRWGQSQG